MCVRNIRAILRPGLLFNSSGRADFAISLAADAQHPQGTYPVLWDPLCPQFVFTPVIRLVLSGSYLELPAAIRRLAAPLGAGLHFFLSSFVIFAGAVPRDAEALLSAWHLGLLLLGCLRHSTLLRGKSEAESWPLQGSGSLWDSFPVSSAPRQPWTPSFASQPWVTAQSSPRAPVC